MVDIFVHLGTFICVLGLACGNYIDTYIRSTSSPCPCDGETGESMSVMQCTSTCSQTQNCKGVSFDLDNTMCCVCSSLDAPGLTSDPGKALYCTISDLVDDIPDDQLTASTFYDVYHGPHRARLYTQEVGLDQGAWSAALYVTPVQYIQARFNGMKEVISIATQGRNTPVGSPFELQRVTSYQVSYSVDCVSFDFITSADNQPTEFPGNVDSNTVVTNDLQEPIFAVCVRLHATTFIEHPSLRFGIMGCDFNP